MFRRKNENYDEYNEKYNEKYDDDYIREEKEYRTECSHDHGQTYENFNSEQQPYNEHNELADKFAARLEPNEHILWCGKAEKGADPVEKGTGCIGDFCVVMIIFSALILILFPVLGIILILSMVYILRETNVKSRAYAITDKRFIMLNRKKFYSVPIGSIGNVAYRSSPRNIGCVFFTLLSTGNSEETKLNFNNGIFAVKDPEKVCRIMKDAIAGSSNF